MLVSYNWLAELVELDGASPEEVAALLTDLGLEAAIADDRRGWFNKVVVGRVATCVKHPNADKLSITTVDVGGSAALNIVCGAANVREGIDVPVALIGATLPGDFKIEKRKVRGELSEGMICSEEELRLAESADGIMILDGAPAPGTPFGEAYEVCDTVIEVDLTPNRGDCASMIGIAREVAAKLAVDLRLPATPIAEEVTRTSDLVTVDLQAFDLCPRYAARLIRGATGKPSPFWMRRRLQAAGIRAINAVVDVTNYVLMETGHPLHAFDASQIKDCGIVVRRAAEGEAFATLDGKSHKLSSDQLVIADADRGVALAGIMGGENSEVTDTTTDILLEAAFFFPGGIRKTARALGVSSESSYRFERGTDVEGLIYAQDRATSLIQQLAGGKVAAGRVDAYTDMVTHRKATLRFARLDAIAGLEIDRDEAIDILNRLGLETLDDHGTSADFAVPTHRWDLEREIDLIEEVIRHVGYGQIDSIIPSIPAADSPAPKALTLRSKARQALRTLGLTEGMSLSFMTPTDADRLSLPEEDPYRKMVAVDNPLTADHTHLRTTGLHNVIAVVAKADDMALFDIGPVFEADGIDAPIERRTVTIAITQGMAPALYSGRSGKRDFFTLKGVVETTLTTLGYAGMVGYAPSESAWLHPRKQSALTVGDQLIGTFGELHPTVQEAFESSQTLLVAELDLTALAAVVRPTPQHRSGARFPISKRDLAVVVEEAITVGAVETTIRQAAGEGVQSVDLFDIFRSDKIGKGKKSLAYSLAFASRERTMTDDEVDGLMETILARLASECGATLR